MEYRIHAWFWLIVSVFLRYHEKGRKKETVKARLVIHYPNKLKVLPLCPGNLFFLNFIREIVSIITTKYLHRVHLAYCL